MKILRNSIFIITVSLLMSLSTSTLTEEKAPSAKKISIGDVTRMALENSLDIQIAKFDAYMKRTSLGKAESIFDTFLSAGATYLHDEKEPSSQFLGDKTIANTYYMGLGKKIPTGTDLKLDVQHTRTDSNSQYEYYNPSHEPTVGISLEQPLGKNFFGLADRALIKITKLDIENADYTSLDDIENALYNVQAAYWKFALKAEEVKIKQDMLMEAQRLYEIYQKKYNIGLAEKADLLAMEANVTVRANDLLIAHMEQDTAKNDLLFLLNESDISIQLAPADSLAISPVIMGLNSALTRAIENRRDYKKVKNTLKANDIDITVKKNALWPEIDLQASLVRNALADEFGQSWDDITDENNSELFLGITLNMPLENRKARAELKETRLKKQKLLLTLKRVERLILLELNNKVEEVNTVKNQVELFRELVNLQQAKLQEEEKRLKFGRSSSDIIVRYENDLLEAQLSLARSYCSYRVKLIELDLAENTLLDKYWEDEL